MRQSFCYNNKKKASNHLFSKQLKNLQSSQSIGGFISIIYSSFACGLRAEGPKAPEAARPASFAPHALKGQKLLAQGIALGNYGRKPVAL